ncbi:probable serine incorporator [Tanacetum coccineum]|uniref:Probable serine incorporator n=1 Tax=Tanacetum coccineum TaxID=301880 RepID=A0ABQ5CBD3_9ASTR
MMETTNNISNRYAKLLEGSWLTQFRHGSNPWMARYVYSVLFLLANLFAWAVRDYGPSALTEMKRLKSCQGGKDCLGTEGVLRVSDIAHFGAGVFLLIQLISIISFITWLNDCCLSEKYAARCHIHSMLLATAAYIVSILGIILMYIWYTPQSSCLLNIFFITWTLVLLQLMTSASLHPKINAGFLTPGLMGLYIVFLCWSAIRSEPDDKCLRKSEASRDWLSIISFVVAVLAIVIATFSTGIDSKCFQFRKDETQNDDDVPYGFGFFHLVFATGAMYFAMLLIGWNYHHPMKKWTIDVGWTSTWVRIVNEWLAVCVYCNVDVSSSTRVENLSSRHAHVKRMTYASTI